MSPILLSLVVIFVVLLWVFLANSTPSRGRSHTTIVDVEIDVVDANDAAGCGGDDD